MIRFVEIYKRYGRQEILSDLALEIHPGEFTLITGANGSGKTTLLRIIAGLDRPDRAGVMLVGEMRSWRKSRRELRKRSVYLHQRPYLIAGTVLDNLRFALSVNRIKGRDARRRLDRAIDNFFLESLLHREARSLSGGEQQRLALGRACLTEPEVMLLDEPTANMDAASRAQFMSMLLHSGNRNQAIVLVSHDVAGLDLRYDHHFDLHDGRLLEVSRNDDHKRPYVGLKLVK
ncbi:MAG TPA: ATP-binding cassette domain-containing protein [Gammaproteobacteria bacterium]|nr:ATP-binding cassette domain-containing protein [Gammaproteobacteria bacterium]